MKQKTYPEKSYASLSVPRQHYLPLVQALDLVSHCQGRAEGAQQGPSAEVFAALPAIIVAGMHALGMEPDTDTYQKGLWLREKELKAIARTQPQENK